MYVFIIIAVVLIALAAYVMFSRNAKSTVDTKANMVLINEYEKRLLSIVTNPKNAEFKTELNKVYEDLKYSDKNGITNEDHKIDSILLSLEKVLDWEGDNRKEIPVIINELKTTLERRKLEMSESKRGGF